MKNEFVTLPVKSPDASRPGGAADPATASLETVGRALGYTQKELALAAGVLNRFAWRFSAEAPPEDSETTEGEGIDLRSNRDHAA